MNKPVSVSVSFVKQKARQLKRELSITQTQALDLAVKEFGYENYKHFLNSKSDINVNSESLISRIYNEPDVTKKATLAIRLLSNPTIPFPQQLEILNLFHDSRVFPEHQSFEWLDDVNYVCTEANLLQKELTSYLLKGYQTPEGEAEIEDFFPYYKAKELNITDVTYEFRGDELYADGNYSLIVEIDREVFVIEEVDLKDARLRDREISGDFGINIGKNKEMDLEHSSIGADNIMYSRDM